jgi:hypothetical protein
VADLNERRLEVLKQNVNLCLRAKRHPCCRLPQMKHDAAVIGVGMPGSCLFRKDYFQFRQQICTVERL